MTQQAAAPTVTNPALFSYERWHESFIRLILRASIFIGLLLIAAAVATDTEVILLVLYGIAYAALLIAYFVRLPYPARAGLFLFLLFMMGISGLLELGVRGDSRIFFAVFIVMAAILFGNRAGIYAIAITFLAHFIIGTLVITGRYTLIEANIPAGDIGVWIMSFLTTTLLALVVTTGQRLLIAEFDAAEARTRESYDLLVQERNSLEAHVAERTRSFERRAVQLQVAAEVGRAATQLRDMKELLGATAQLISERFNFYHVGIFLLDERGENAVLRASNSEGGKRMLARNHQLKVGQVGIVGYVTAMGEPRIALNVGKDAVYFDNPDLPETKSEMALPLVIGKTILGALDVQSVQEAAFTEDDIAILRVLADQLAIAIENARLFSDSQAALEKTRRAYGDISRSGWERLMQEKQTEIGYISLATGDIKPVSGRTKPEFQKAIATGEPVLSNKDTTLHMPISVRGEVIGVIQLDKPKDGGRWSAEDISIATNLAEQLGTALESARLYNDISQRAERENIISSIATKISSSVRLDSILFNTVQELGKTLSNSEVILQLGGQSTSTKGKSRE